MEEPAPAKVNLFLHVGPPGADGFHPLASLVAFADVGDVVGLAPAAEMGFACEGPFAAALGPPSDNLVVRAREIVLARAAGPVKPFRLTLDKRLPVASGLGGGSSDAGAAIRLMTRSLALSPQAAAEVAWAAAALGADMAMCLAAQAALALGRGERLSPAPAFPDLDAVLVNPGVESPTGAVYRAFDAAGAPGSADAPALPERIASPREMASLLRTCRNDLEPPACGLQPAIGEALAAIGRDPRALIARMSGSGATCFALCATKAEANGLAGSLAAAHPRWWVAPCRLAGRAA